MGNVTVSTAAAAAREGAAEGKGAWAGEGSGGATRARAGDGPVCGAVRAGGLGWAARAPFDAIHVGASCSELPLELVRQLRVGGRMVVPVGRRLLCVDRMEGGTANVCEVYDGLDMSPLEQ